MRAAFARTGASCSRLSAEVVAVGRVGRPHGLNGAFFVEHASAAPERLAVGATLEVEGRPARVVESKRSGGRLVVRLDRPVERGAVLAVPRASLPPPPEGSFYVVDLVGLAVEDEDGAPLGRVADVAPGVANDVLELDSGAALPLVDDCVREIDPAAGRIVVASGFVEPD